MLPQNTGFFTIEANEDFADGDAARSVAEGGSDSAAYPQHRSRRSTGESPMPNVYGQVIKCICTTLLNLNTLHHPRLLP